MKSLSDHTGMLIEEARSLMAATADVAGEKVGEARKRLAAALENKKEIYRQAREQTVEKARAINEVVHEHPYQSICIAVGVGAMVGYLLASRCNRND